MNQQAYFNKKLVTGITAVTVLSIATISSNPLNSDLTTSSNSVYNYKPAALYSNYNGEMCFSSELIDQVGGELLVNSGDNVVDLKRKSRMINVNLKISEVQRHISTFDFEEEYEEI